MSQLEYVHGHSGKEETRLFDQANTLSELLHHDTRFPGGANVLETGCGVGAQTIILSKNNPETHFTSFDIAFDSITKAKALINQGGIANVDFHSGDIFHLPFDENVFDHIFVCFVLEHLKDPLSALHSLKSHLKPGGTITVIEGDHGSTYFHPHSDMAMKAVQCLIDVQAHLGGDSLIGRQLYPLLNQAGFADVHVSLRPVYADSSRPEWVEGFTKNTFNAMVEGVEDQALEMGLMDEVSWRKGIEDLYAAATGEGTFCYTFFKGVAVKDSN
ncbi:MAG: methyltransferase domain-containing protein [Anaerolineales bacterium]